MHNDLITTIRRDTCHFDACGMCPRGKAPCPDKLALQAADAIEELSQPRWIPVTERLPEKTNHYLVHIECKCDGELMSKWTQIAWFCKKFYWEHSHGTEFFEETVTHWTPLPQPPKEET